MMQAYFCVTNPLTSEALDCLEEYPNMVRWSSLILRLADDLGTSTVYKWIYFIVHNIKYYKFKSI